MRIDVQDSWYKMKLLYFQSYRFFSIFIFFFLILIYTVLIMVNKGLIIGLAIISAFFTFYVPFVIFLTSNQVLVVDLQNNLLIKYDKLLGKYIQYHKIPLSNIELIYNACYEDPTGINWEIIVRPESPFKRDFLLIRNVRLTLRRKYHLMTYLIDVFNLWLVQQVKKENPDVKYKLLTEIDAYIHSDIKLKNIKSIAKKLRKKVKRRRG